MSERNAVLCCALLILSLAIGPAATLVRAAGSVYGPQSSSSSMQEATPLDTASDARAAAQAASRGLPAEAAPGTAVALPSPTIAVQAAPLQAPGDVTPVAAEPAAAPAPEPKTAPTSLLESNQIIVYYGTPLAASMGILGAYSPDEAAARVKLEAALYDQLNGSARGALPAMDLIYSIAQGEPTGNGLFLRYLDDDKVRQYLEMAERDDLQLILDLQIGTGEVLAEVRKIEPYLINPRVHVAIDPEYAVGSGGVPIDTPGRITGAEINEVQTYLAQLVRSHDLPPKLLIVHQYLEETIVNGDDITTTPGVDLVINMDGIGQAPDKIKKYQHFAGRSYAEHRGFNVFLSHDDDPMSERDVMRLLPLPDMVFYQ